MLIRKTIFFVLTLHFAYSNNDWIDPHDMNKNGYRKSSSKTVHINTNQESTNSSSDNISLSHFKRLISILLNTMGGQDKDSGGCVTFDLSKENYNFLKEFVESKDVDAYKLRRVDHILSESISKSSSQNIADFIISWNDYFYFIFNNSSTIICLSTICVLFVSYKLLQARLTIWSVVKYLILFAWVIDFAFTWIHLVQEAEINKLVLLKKYQAVLPQCDPSKMSVWQYLWSFISDPTDCREYHSLIYKEQFWTIPPLTVISHQLGVVIYTPAAHIGKALGSFTSGLLSTLPWGVNIILLPVLLLFVIVVICIILSFTTQTSISFNILHVFQLNFGSRQREAIGDVISGRNLTRLLEMTHRPMVEDVRIPNNDNSNDNAQDVSCSEKRGPNLSAQSTSTARIQNNCQNCRNNVSPEVILNKGQRKNKSLKSSGSGNKSAKSSNKGSSSETRNESDNCENNATPEEPKVVLNDEQCIKCDNDKDMEALAIKSGASGDFANSKR